MSTIRIHLQDAALPPLRLALATRPRIAPVFALAPVRRGLFCLAALALPVLGIGLADQVHRANRSGTPQAAAPLTPSRGAAPSLSPRSGGTTLATLDFRQRP
ncbi:hypothetical protein U8607_03025 [Methylobacterium durans]|uniref:hypothetical protein n=1 Tax=Methylobacterium durans TaxID=2202825 RepID=UPI002AFE0606|nr:hypothetical protein [Methylobacterium durans]MEA1831044.1 hypothetical protein [Methylobacterium durans]